MIDRVNGPDELFISGMYALRLTSTIEAAKISHIVSVLRQPLDKALFENRQHLVIEVDDVEDDNLIEHFSKTNEFISDALKNRGAVLIHCAMGKSRSATILAAYLMQSRRLGAEEAVKLIQETRPFVEPNPGFMEQLKIYYDTGYTTALDEHLIYQRWLDKKDLQLSVAAGRAPERIRFREEESRIAEINQVKEGGTPEKAGFQIELRCKKCRRTLANSEFLSPHVPKTARTPSPRSANTACSHHFVEPMSWMKPELEARKLEGKLDCPKCNSKVGSYSWPGIKCSCGEWVTPGISLARGKVDEVRVRL